MVKIPEDTVAKIVSLCKRRGIVYQNSEIYGGIQGFYDYGPIGSMMKYNWKNLWWRDNVLRRPDIVGIDGAIITHPKVWQASGHLKNFTDQLLECQKCHHRFRPDLINNAKLCPDCGGRFAPQKSYNLMFKTEVGVVAGDTVAAYLRPEACQTIYLDYKNIIDSTRVKIPFGIAQIGKAFRNEITPKNFLYRTREFEQWDIQYFVPAQEMDKWYGYWKEERMRWYRLYFSRPKSLRFREHPKKELAFYAKKAFDIEYQAPWGWTEMEGIHWRSDYDLSQHAKFSGQDLSYTDISGQKYIPWITETSGGVDRSFFYLLLDAYREEKLDNGETRIYLKIHPAVAAYKIAILPLAANKVGLIDFARKIYDRLLSQFATDWDDSSNIGKKYRRQDEIGTPWCLVVDYLSLEDGTVTIRHRDTMKQIRLPADQVDTWLKKRLNS